MNKIDILAIEEKLERCKNLSFDDVDINNVADLSEIKISRKKSSQERILDFLNSIDNPYIFKCEGLLVKIGFSNNEITAEKCITSVIKSIYK